MTDRFHQRLEQELAHRRGDSLHRKVHVYQEGLLNLCSNDYFQLRRHPKVIAGARDAIETYGSGSGASPLLYGCLPCHQHLLAQLQEWKHKPTGMLFNAGFLANQAIIRHLPGDKDLVLADRLIHHSLAQALTRCRARFKRYDHLNLDNLEEMLSKYHDRYETIFVVTESVFSMDGDYPDLKRLMELKKQTPFLLVLDEAHGTGVYGETGGGLAEFMGVLDDVDIMVGTFGKALGSMGAYVLAKSPTVIDYLINIAGEFIYSTFLSPGQVGAASAAIDILKSAGEKREALRTLAREFRDRISDIGWKVDSYDSPIIPLIVGDSRSSLALQNKIMEQGILVGAVRPPTVPQGSARLRISLNSEVTSESLNPLLAVLKEWKKT